MKDFRGEGPPEDIGIFQLPCNIIVYQHTFSGVAYIVAARRGSRGWILVDHRLLTDPETCMNNAMNALTPGRTEKENVVIIGHYTGVGQLVAPDYTLIQLIGSITARAALNVSLVVNSNPGAGNVFIEVSGGKWNMNGANQAADCSTIFFNNIANSRVSFATVVGGRRFTGLRGEGIEFMNSTDCTAAVNTVTVGDYDGIKFRSPGAGAIAIGNTIDVPAGTSSGIQIGSVTNAVIADNVVNNHGADTSAGFKIDNGTYSVVIGNTVRGTSVAGIELITVCNYNIIIDNSFYNCLWGVNFRDVGPPTGNVVSNNFITLRAAGGFGIRMMQGASNVLEENKLFGVDAAGTGISIDVAVTGTILHHNYYLGIWGTKVSNASASTIYDTDFQMLLCDIDTLIPNVTRYGGITGNRPVQVTESAVQMKVTRECFLMNATITLAAAPGGAQSYTFTLRKNGISQALVIVIIGAATTGSDTTNRVLCAANDLIDWMVVSTVTANASGAACGMEMSRAN